MRVKIKRCALLILLPLFFSGCIYPTNPPQTTINTTNTTEPVTEKIPANVPVVLRMTFAGDCTLGMYNEDADPAGIRFPKVYEKAGSLTYPFDLVKHFFERDDLTVINFEGVLTDRREHAPNTYVFRGPPEYANMLPAASIEAATLANNHALDYLEQGFLDTKAHLQNAGVGVMYENAPLITEIQGVQVVLIADNTAFIEGITEEEVAARVFSQIEEHKREDNIVIVNIHWGIERNVKPTSWQQKTARMWIDAGADLIVGHHPHVLQGIEQYGGKYIVYSLGNFAFGGISTAPRKETALLHITATAVKNSLLQTETANNPEMDIAGDPPRIDIAGDKPRIEIAGDNPKIDIAVTPSYYTSSNKYIGSLPVNNYQPMPVTGEQANAVISLLLQRSALLENGIKELKVES